jgi:hypothetical protein
MMGVPAVPNMPAEAQEPGETIGPSRPDVPAIRDITRSAERSGCKGPSVPVVTDIAGIRRGYCGNYARHMGSAMKMPRRLLPDDEALY